MHHISDDEVSNAYDIVMEAIDDIDFLFWKNERLETLSEDYDEYTEHVKEPIGFDIWALRVYLDAIES